MITSIARLKSHVVFAGLALTLVTSAGMPLLGSQDVMAKGGKHNKQRHTVSREVKQDKQSKQQDRKYVLGTDVAIQDIAIAPHADAGHRTVVVTVRNAGFQPVSGFTIGLKAKRADGTLRTEVFSAPVSLGAWQSTTKVEFRLGCSWINNGTLTARTNPTPLVGERNATNNTRVESFGGGCV